jgi:hypothetical protein
MLYIFRLTQPGANMSLTELRPGGSAIPPEPDPLLAYIAALPVQLAS